MKRLLFNILTIATIICATSIESAAQEVKIKLGKPSDEELKMTEYAPDKEAEAVFLYESNTLWYDISSDINLYYERTLRIKILKEEGKSWANFTIPFRQTPRATEDIVELKACAINLVNGKVVKTDITKEFINTEQVSNTLYVRKIAIPEVRVGTIIDLRIKVKSDFIANIPSINIQHSIPVKYSYYNIRIPDYLGYSTRTRGYLPMNLQQKEYASTAAGYPSLSFTIKDMTSVHEDIPAMKDADFVYYVDDYIAGFDYEINSIRLLNIINKNFSVSWVDYCKTLDNDEQFGKCMNTKDLLEEQTKSIFASDDSDIEKIRKVTKVVRDNIKWNDRYSLYANKNGLKAALKSGTGNSADMNFLLYCALKNAGYNVAPVLLNPRHLGRLPYGSPLADKINAFVLRIRLKDGKDVYVDASDKHSDVNVLPPILLVDHARVFDLTKEAPIVNLSNLSRNQQIIQLESKINPDGTATANSIQRYTNLNAYSKAKDYEKYSSEDEYIEHLEKEDNITISEYRLDGIETMSPTEFITFTKTLDQGGDLIMFDPTFGQMDITNPFTDENRVLPVELPCSRSITILSNITIPDDYEIEDIPQSISITFGDKNDILVLFKCDKVGENKVSTQIRFDINRIIFPNNEYSELFELYAKISETFKQKIVIKKK